jgi:muconate cycloisomerase
MSEFRIAAVEAMLAEYPIRGDFKFFRGEGERQRMRETVIVKIVDQEGNFGLGQSVPSHTWSYETVETVKTTIARYLGPGLIGMDPFETEQIWGMMNRTIAGSFSTGQPICKGGIDLALFDLTGRILQQTAGERWGRSTDKPVTLSWTIDVRSVEEVGSEIQFAGERGYRNFNVKGTGRIEFDVDVCREIRKLAPAAFVWIDANGGYCLEDALRVGPRLAELGIAAFEQPLPANQLTGYRKLVEQGALPILMDEGIVALEDLRTFHQLGLLNGVAMKVSRSGGVTGSRKIVEYLLEEGLEFYASGLTDPDWSLAASLLLFSGYELPHPAALNGGQYLEGSYTKEPCRVVGDRAFPPIGVGLGLSANEDLMGDSRQW